MQQGLDDAQAGRVIDDDMLEWSWKIKLRSCKLRWSDRSTDDLANIYTFIARNNPKNAKQWVEKLRNRARSAANSALIGRVVPELG